MTMWELREPERKMPREYDDFHKEDYGKEHKMGMKSSERVEKRLYECGYEDGYRDAMKEAESYYGERRMR